jgi:hypothetical protein
VFLGINSSYFNNFIRPTRKIPNEIIYSFTPNFVPRLVTNTQEIDILLARIKVTNILDLIAFRDKVYYDRKYILIFLKVRE